MRLRLIRKFFTAVVSCDRPSEHFADRKVSKMGFEESSCKSRRGALIVFEGCDHSGKTTQAKRLVEALVAAGKPSIFMCFPDRSTQIGGIINSYLSCQNEVEDHAIHLLFSANRWELLPKIMSNLKEGTNVIIDRYAFSGVAFSAAKEGMPLEWCKKSDVGLPKPDLVLFLDISPEEAQRRGQFGEERYEKKEFQKRVYANFKLLMDDTWEIINGHKTVNELQEIIQTRTTHTIAEVKDQKIDKLWI
ncbi:thymidylate kinase isoform X2 [Panulirus ornatus]|uniref:thymidylate kinase isoform X2 n=1 Tax=Panulirus ornatus TaxID=150431 RepID=UPI003A8B05D6